jgi:VanZ family protein
MSDPAYGPAKLSYWFPAILVAILISIFSTRYFASEQTGRVILPVLHWVFPWASRRMQYLMHLAIRKAAHVTEFGGFSITVFRGVRRGRSGWQFDWALATLAIAVSYAALDEWHQSFVPLRDATPRDAAIDAFGALLAQCLVWGYATRRWSFTAASQACAGRTVKKQGKITG